MPYGVEPNEHGTWLYGRDGWCDGQDVKQWVIDVTSQVSDSPGNNIVHIEVHGHKAMYGVKQPKHCHGFHTISETA